MDQKLLKALSGLNLSDNESRVYIAALELGSATVSQIAKKAGVERVNTYNVIEKLMSKGFVYQTGEGKLKTYSAVSPKRLEAISRSRTENLKNALPQLLSIENSNEVKPKVRYYQGIEGIKEAFEETLKCDKDEEILAVATAEGIYQALGDWTSEYLKRRIEKGIKMRAIVDNSKIGKKHKSNDKQELRTTRLVDKDKFYFSNEINIFDNKVMIVSYKDKMGLIIESKQVADTQRSVFELAWKGANNKS